MDNNQYDYSELSHPMANQYDYSELSQPMQDEHVNRISDLLNNPSGAFANILLQKSLNHPETIQGMIPNVQNPKDIRKEMIQGAGALGAMANPEFGIGMKMIDPILNAVGRIGTGAISNTAMEYGSPEERNKNFGDVYTRNVIANTALESLPAALKGVGVLAEKIRPEKLAGQIAENIRNIAQKGYAKAQEFYNPVHKKYDENLVTTMPEEYLGFTPEDRQYFKPAVNRAYRDFKAEPTFKNLHYLQHQMGKYPELWPMRQDVNSKLESFLGKDPEMLENYLNGRNVMRDEYYPYTDNDTMHDIVENENKIKTHDPQKLNKALNDSNLVDKARKSAIPINHPLVQSAQQMNAAMDKAQLAQYAIPATLSTIGGEIIHPGLGGGLAGLGAGSVFGYMGSPIAAKYAQNPYLVKALQNIRNPYSTIGRYGIPYITG